MNQKMITEAQFADKAALAQRFFEDELFDLADGGQTMAPEEVYASALADIRSLIFDYV